MCLSKTSEVHPTYNALVARLSLAGEPMYMALTSLFMKFIEVSQIYIPPTTSLFLKLPIAAGILSIRRLQKLLTIKFLFLSQ